MTKLLTRVLPLALAVTLLAAACGDSSEPGTPTTGAGPITTEPSTSPDTGDTTPPTLPPVAGGPVRADVPRATTTDVSDAELAAVVAGNQQFGFDLFELVAADDANVLVSPYSVAAALTMTYAGARGETAGEMREALNLALGDDRIHQARNELDLRITAVPEGLTEEDGEPFTIRVANSLWGQAGYPFLEEYLALLAESYDAGMNLVDFAQAAEEARVTINDWVEEQTEGRIVDLIPQGIVTEATRLVLVNAIWFKASWQVPFSTEATADAPFTLLDGSSVQVPTMHGQIAAQAAAGDGWDALRLRYAGDASMLIVVPEQGRFAEVRKRLGPELLKGINAMSGFSQLQVSLPRFEYRSEVGMKEPLRALGIERAFVDPAMADGADFTGMTPQRELYVEEVVHQAFIAVDEKGTEAAAATAVVVSLTSAMEPGTFTVDRPFLFLIQHDSTGEILFVGQVVDPR